MKNRLIQIDDITIDESIVKNNTLVDVLCKLIAAKRLQKTTLSMLAELLKK